MGITRRDFMRLSATAGGGLLIAGAWPRTTVAVEPAAAREPVRIGAFVRIEPDGRVIIGARGCEIGQGVKTSLPMLIAEELDVPWERVVVEQLPYGLRKDGDKYASLYGPQGAGGSTNIPEGYTPLRQVGAAARHVLVAAAAAQWNVPAESLRTDAGRVLDSDGRTLDYAQLAPAAARLPLPVEPLPLKSPERFRIIGTPTRGADVAEIVRGAPLYGLDQRLPGALVAVIARAPVGGATLKRLNDAAARRVRGVRSIHPIGGPAPRGQIPENLAAGVAVLANDTWSALQGRKALDVEWDDSAHPRDDANALLASARAAVDRAPTAVVQEHGDYAAAKARAARTYAASYAVPFLAHATLEPQNVMLDLREDRALLVGPLQSPGGASRLVAKLTGLPRERIEIRLTRSGGGFGRRLANDFVAEAVKVAQAAKQPIRLVWTREDDFTHDFYRPMGVHRLEAALAEDGQILGWRHHVASPGIKGRDAGLDADAPAWIGVHEKDEVPARLVPAWRHEYTALESSIPRGWWRAPLPTFIAFPVQSFIDEIAAETRQDPLDLRLRLLGTPREIEYAGHGGPRYDTGRLAKVLTLAAERVGWGRRMPEGHGLGIAAHFTFGGYAAHALEVQVRDRAVRVVRCACAIDVGQVVNPLGVEAQAAGGTLDGLGTALELAMQFEHGRARQQNFDAYPLLRMGDAPNVEVIVVRSSAPPSGAGEMGIPTVAPALASAIHAATGIRVRDLPLGPALRSA
jgi:isoquinoline 1-oxidoreductase beta subunit